MTPFSSIASGANRASDHFPWPRFVVSEAAWEHAGEALDARTSHCSAIGASRVRYTSPSPINHSVTSASSPANAPMANSLRSLCIIHPPVGSSERSMICTASGHAALPTTGPGSITAAGGARRRNATASHDPEAAYSFLPVEGESLHQIPVGPVHAGIIEPGHFRFTANGETVVRLEQRFGYVHKGIESLMEGATLDKAAGLAGRVSGDSTVAYAIAFARAVEAATGGTVPARGGLAARTDGRAGARRQSPRRHRCHLQRRGVRADACPLRGAARTSVADVRGLLRPSADDGSGEARRRGRPFGGRKREHPRPPRGNPTAVGGVGDHLR